MSERVQIMYFGLLADEETTTGFLLASLGRNRCIHGAPNYFIVNQNTNFKILIDRFMRLYMRKDIGILLLTYEVADRLRNVLSRAKKVLPIILKLPIKNQIGGVERRQRMSLADIVSAPP